MVSDGRISTQPTQDTPAFSLETLFVPHRRIPCCYHWQDLRSWQCRESGATARNMVCLRENRPLKGDQDELNRFVEAQSNIYERALAELKWGEKRSHWMWLLVPQIDGLGSSPAARFYAIKSADEAKAYPRHPELGLRLIECSKVPSPHQDLSASDSFAFPDDVKLRSCMTLFAAVSEPAPVFSLVLRHYSEGQSDPRALEILKQQSCR